MDSPIRGGRTGPPTGRANRRAALGRTSSGRRPSRRRGVDVGAIPSQPASPFVDASALDRVPGVVERGDAEALGRPVAAGVAVSALFGVTLSMVAAALSEGAADRFGGRSAPIEAILAGAIAAVAIGVRVPQRLTTWFCAMAWHRFVRRGTPSAVSAVLIHRGEADRPLYWIVLSVVALAAGVTTATLPLAARAATAVYGGLLAHFVWPDPLLAALQVATALAAAFVPLAMVGLAVSCAHHLSCPHGRWNTAATGWLLIGASVGVVVHRGMRLLAAPADLALTASSLPAFVVALVAAGLIASRSPATGVDQRAALPVWSDRRPAALRAGIVAIGGISAAAAVGWNHLLDRSTLGPTTAVSLTLSALGLGMIAGSTVLGSTRRTMGGFGIACVAAGVTLVAALGACERSIGGRGGWSVACAALAAIGFTTATGRQALMASVASKSSEGAKMMGRLLLCGAGAVWTTSVVVRAAPVEYVLSALAVALLLLGGAMIALEPSYSAPTRRTRMAMVSALVLATVAILRFG